MSRSRKLGVAAALFAVALLPRLIYVFMADPARNFSELDRAAESLAVDGTIANVFSPHSGPTAHVAPVFPMINAAIYRTLGVESAWRLRLPAIAAALATALAIALLPLLAEKARLAPLSGYLASFLASVTLLHPFVEASGVWETPYTFLLFIAFALTLIRARERDWQSPLLTVFLGVLLGIAALLSPVVLPAFAIALCGELFVSRDAWRRVGRSLPLIGFVCLCVLAPWIWRNLRVFDKFIPVRSNLGLELVIGNSELATGRTQGPAFEAHHPLGSPEALKRYEEMGEVAYMQSQMDEAKAFVLDHPVRFAGLCAKRTYLFWLPPLDLWSAQSHLSRYKQTTLWLLTLFSWTAVAVLFVRRHPYRWVLLALLVGPALPFMATHIEIRYRAYVAFPSLLLSAHLIQFGIAAIRGTGPAAEPRS